MIDDFGLKISKIFKNSLGIKKKLIINLLILKDEYDNPASRYHKDVSSKKREVLATNLKNELHLLFTKQLQKLTDVYSFYY